MASPRQVVLKASRLRRLMISGEARRRRERLLLSFREAGAGAGVDATTVLRWEALERQPRGDAAARYLDFLEVLERETGPGAA